MVVHDQTLAGRRTWPKPFRSYRPTEDAFQRPNQILSSELFWLNNKLVYNVAAGVLMSFMSSPVRTEGTPAQLPHNGSAFFSSFLPRRVSLDVFRERPRERVCERARFASPTPYYSFADLPSAPRQDGPISPNVTIVTVQTIKFIIIFRFY